MKFLRIPTFRESGSVEQIAVTECVGCQLTELTLCDASPLGLVPHISVAQSLTADSNSAANVMWSGKRAMDIENRE